MKIIKVIICIVILMFCMQFFHSECTTTITGEGVIKTGDAKIVLSLNL